MKFPTWISFKAFGILTAVFAPVAATADVAATAAVAATDAAAATAAAAVVLNRNLTLTHFLPSVTFGAADVDVDIGIDIDIDIARFYPFQETKNHRFDSKVSKFQFLLLDSNLMEVYFLKYYPTMFTIFKLLKGDNDGEIQVLLK